MIDVVIPGIRTLRNPLALIRSSVEISTGALFHEPSSGTASRVFPRFQPGFKELTALDGVIGSQVAVHSAVVVEIGLSDLVVMICVVEMGVVDTGVVDTEVFFVVVFFVVVRLVVRVFEVVEVVLVLETDFVTDTVVVFVDEGSVPGRH